MSFKIKHNLAKDHVFTMDSGYILGRQSSGEGLVEQIPISASGPFVLRAGDTMTGNLGVGGGPSAWGSGYYGVEVGKAGNGIYGSTTTPEAGLVSNLFWNGTNWKYVASDEGSVLTLDGAGSLRYFTVPSGTAGNNATLTERFHVDNSGRAGVNVTPDGSGRAGSLTVGYAGSGLDGYNGGIDLRANTFYNGTNWKHANTGTAALVQVAASSPPGFFAYGAVSASGGSNVTWTALFQVLKGYSVGLEGASVYTGTGITFPATQSASSDANTIDDYEEGTWTAVDLSGASLSFTNNATGRYVKIGRNVYCNLSSCTYPATASGLQAIIGGLPFTVSGGISYYGAHIGFNNKSLPGLSGLAVDATTGVYMYNNSSAAAMANSSLTSGTVYGLTFWYQAAN